MTPMTDSGRTGRPGAQDLDRMSKDMGWDRGDRWDRRGQGQEDPKQGPEGPLVNNSPISLPVTTPGDGPWCPWWKSLRQWGYQSGSSARLPPSRPYRVLHSRSPRKRSEQASLVLQE